MAESTRVLVTGADGFVGRHLVAMLRSTEREVIRVVRGRREEADIVADLRAGLPDGAIRDGDTLVHLAAIAHRSATETEHRRVTYQAAVDLGLAAERAGASHFVYLSSAKVYGSSGYYDRRSPLRSTDVYGRAKADAEEALTAMSGPMALSILRPPLVYGPGAGGNFGLLVGAVRRRVPVPMSRPAPRHALASIDSVSRAIAAVVNSAPPRSARAAYHVADRSAVGLDDLVDAIGKGLQRAARTIPLPASLLRAAQRPATRLSGRDLSALHCDFVLAPDPELEALGWHPETDTLGAIAAAASAAVNDR